MTTKKVNEREFGFIYVGCMIFRALGLFPCGLKKVTHSGHVLMLSTPVFVGSKWARIYSFVVLVVIYACMFRVFKFYFEGRVKDTELGKISDITDIVLMLLTFTTILIYYTSHHRNFTQMLNRMVEIEYKLRNLKHQRDNDYVLLVVLFILNVTMWIILFTSYILYFGYDVTFSSYYFPFYTIQWFIIQYSIFLRILVKHLKTINSMIKSSTTENDCRHVYALVQFYRNETFICEVMANLRQLYATCNTVAQSVSDFFSFPILTTLGFILFSLSANFFELIAYVKTDKDTTAKMFYLIAWILAELIPVYYLTQSVNNILIEVKQTGKILQQLIIHTDNQKCVAQLREFSHYVLHVDLQFTAHGLFSLDGSMLHSMLSAVTTYVVIFIQFDSGSDCHNMSEINETLFHD